MKSPPTETGPPNPKEEKSEDNEEEKKPGVKTEVQSEIEKDSGYSDSSSDSVSSEETNGSTKVDEPATTQGTSTVQTVYTPIYILQNVILKQPRLIVFQPSVRRHRKRPSPSSYLPILRSYPRIAPRLTPPSIPSPTPVPRRFTPPISRPASSQLLEISLRSLALLRRTRETQRCVRELRAHARLYEQALHGEEGGWERLRKAMEQSGGYRKIASSSVSDQAADTSLRAVILPEPATSQDVSMTSSGDEDPQTEDTMTSSESMTSPQPMSPECKDGNV